MEGGEEDLLRWLGLERNCKHYRYLVQVREIMHYIHAAYNPPPPKKKADIFTELFNWFFQGNCAKVSSINDKSDWKTVRKALSVIDLSESDIEVRMHIKSLYSLCVGD